MKKYVTIQNDIKDCGACSLSSIIKYYDGYVSLEKIKEDTYTNTNGTTMYHLSQAARSYGFDTIGYNIDFSSLIKENINIPFIANVVNNNYLHFVVVYSINNKKNIITIMDPSSGIKKYSFLEFKNIFNNKILVIKKKNLIVKYDENFSFIKHFTSIIRKEKKLTIRLFLTNVLLIIFSIVCGLYFKISLNIVNDYKDTRMLIRIVVIFLFIYIIKILINYIKDYYETYINKNIDIELIIPFLKHLILLPLNYVQTKTSGEILTRVNELNNLKELFTKVFLVIFINISLALSTLCILFFINKTICFILCFVLVLYFIVSLVFSKSIYLKVKKNIEYEAVFNNSIIETIKGLLSIKEMNAHYYFNQIINNKYTKYLKDSFNIKIFINKINFIKSIFYDIGLFLVNSICIYYILINKMNIIDLIAINSLIVYVSDPIKEIMYLIPNISYYKATISKISDFLQVKNEPLDNSFESFISGDIEIKKLNYSYNNYYKCLNNVNITIKKNDHVMLYGSSGCGKSTLCKIISRIIYGHKGNVLIGGVNILDYELSTIRKNISYLSQNEYLFEDTIKNNLLLGKNVTINKLNEVIKLCKLESVINKKPLRLESYIDNENDSFSGGERQRLILARCLLKNSKIIILDEALSEVEDSIEKEIICNINNHYKDKTIIYVTHKKHFELFDKVIHV